MGLGRVYVITFTRSYDYEGGNTIPVGVSDDPEQAYDLAWTLAGEMFNGDGDSEDIDIYEFASKTMPTLVRSVVRTTTNKTSPVRCSWVERA